MWRGDANVPSTASVELPQFVPLTALYVGRFPSTNHAVLFLWVSGFGPSEGAAPKRLVLVVVQDEAKPQPARTLRSWTMRNCPYFAPQSGNEARLPFRGVCTFEIGLSDIVGLDYQNPLLVDASRLVLEARKITRRWFSTLEQCSRHYSWEDFPRSRKRDDGSEPPLVQLVSELYRPRANSDGGRPALPRVVPHSEFCRFPSSPSKKPRQEAYWRQDSEEQRYRTVNRVFLTAERVLGVVTRSPKESDPVVAHSNSEELEGLDSAFEEVIHSETINFRFDDPFLPYVLREVIHDPEHPKLLRLYEAGLPAWAILLPQYTGLYRRWMRIFIFGILLLISCISMLLGFYDLYKRIPAVRALLKQVLGPMSSKLEELVVVRFSVLLAWLLPYPAIFRRVWHGTGALLTCCRQVCGDLALLTSTVVSWVGVGLNPLVSALWLAVSTLCQPFGFLLFAGHTAVHVCVNTVWMVLSTCRGVFWTATRLVGTLCTAPVEAGQTTAALLRQEFKLARQACMSIYHGTIFLAVECAKHQASLRLCFWRWQLRTRRSLLAMVGGHPVCALVVLTAGVAHLFSDAGLLDWTRLALARRLPAAPALCAEGPLGAVAAQGVVWRLAAPLLCGRAWRALAHEQPSMLAADLLCSVGAPQVCWERRGGGRRCRCPYEAVQALNITLDRPGALALAFGPHRHSNGSLTATRIACPTSTSTCLITGDALRGTLRGGASELWALSWRPGWPLPEAAAAAFVLDAPRTRAEPPTDVRLCLESGGEPWSLLLPICDDEDDEVQVAAKGTSSGELATQEAPVRIRTSWRPGRLQSCHLLGWEADLHLPSVSVAEPVALCRASLTSHTVCSGLAPVLPLPLRRSGRSEPEGVGYGVRARVRARCADPVDAAQAAESPPYAPVELPQELAPVHFQRSVWYGLGLCLLTVEAWTPAWTWAQAWMSDTAFSLLQGAF